MNQIDTWRSVTKRFEIGTEKGYLTVMLKNNVPIRILLDIAKQGSETSGFARMWAQTFSKALNHGVPLDELIEDAIGVNFDPSGWSDMGFAKSIVDYVAKYLKAKFGKTE